MRNLLSNYDFETWTVTDSAPDGWVYSLTGSGFILCETDSPYYGRNAAKLWTDGTSGNMASIYYNIHAGAGIDYWKGRTVTAGVWAWGETGDSSIYALLYDGISYNYGRHPGDGAWRWLSANLTVDSAATYVRLRLYARSRVSSVALGMFDLPVALEGSWVPQTPYPFENVSYRLGISSADSIPLFPGEDYSLGIKQSRSRDRTAAGTVYEFLAGQYRQISMPVEYVPASHAAIVNSWWQSQAPLLFFVESGSPITTAVYSCMLMGKTAPLDEYNQPDYQMFKGDIALEGY